jgi:hypothetical protein
LAVSKYQFAQLINSRECFLHFGVAVASNSHLIPLLMLSLWMKESIVQIK